MDEHSKEIIMDTDDVLDMLDDMVKKWDEKWWNDFWRDKDKPVPFFTELPDENLMHYLKDGRIQKGKAMDIGCGNGRNSRFLVDQGFQVEGVDFSAESLAWAKEFTPISDRLTYTHASFFDLKKNHCEYDFIYDSGCLHHIKPHRRAQYLKKVFNLLKPGGYFGLVCFNEKGAETISDYAIYENTFMSGGFGYSEEKLRKVLSPYFEIVAFNQMSQGVENKSFGQDTMWTALLYKVGHQSF